MAHAIKLDTDIIPLSDFRKNTAAVMKQLKKDRRPIVLTQNGKSAAVLIDVAEYQSLTDDSTLIEGIVKGEHAIAEGRTFSNEQAKQVMEKWLR